MLSPLEETFKKEAAYAVLERLGEDMSGMLKQNLALIHHVYLDKSETWTLEELRNALQKIIGEYGASLLLREIHKEIELLKNQQMH